MIAKVNKEIALEVLKKIDNAAKGCGFVSYPYTYNMIKVEGNIEKDKAYDSSTVVDDENNEVVIRNIEKPTLNIEEVFDSLTYGKALFIDAFELEDILNASEEHEDIEEGELADYTLLYLDGSEHVINTDDSDEILQEVEIHYTITFLPKGEDFELFIGMHSIDQGPGMWASCLITENGDTVKKLEGLVRDILGLKV
jgi:hypothetical protein